MGNIYIVNIIESCAPKLCRIIPLHFWSNKFQVPFWENPTTHHFCFFGLDGRVHDCQNQYYFIFGDTKILQIRRPLEEGHQAARNLLDPVCLFLRLQWNHATTLTFCIFTFWTLWRIYISIKGRVFHFYHFLWRRAPGNDEDPRNNLEKMYINFISIKNKTGIW